MKGQYLAIESVTTFGMGLMIAIGAITAFSGYKDSLLNKASQKQIDVIESRITRVVYTLKNVDTGQKKVELPENIGSRDYKIAFDNGMKILLGGKVYSSEFSGVTQKYDFKGTVSGGSVKVFKKGKQFTLRAN